MWPDKVITLHFVAVATSLWPRCGSPKLSYFLGQSRLLRRARLFVRGCVRRVVHLLLFSCLGSFSVLAMPKHVKPQEVKRKKEEEEKEESSESEEEESQDEASSSNNDSGDSSEEEKPKKKADKEKPQPVVTKGATKGANKRIVEEEPAKTQPDKKKAKKDSNDHTNGHTNGHTTGKAKAPTTAAPKASKITKEVSKWREESQLTVVNIVDSTVDPTAPFMEFSDAPFPGKSLHTL